MAKPKLDFSNSVISVENGKLVLTEKNEIDNSIVQAHNLDDELKKFANTEHLKLTVKVGKKRASSPRASKFKYTCGCGNLIVSKSDVLNIKCLDCNEEFVKVEE